MIPALAQRASELKVGPGTDPNADFGPVISKAAKERIEGFIASGVDQNATLLLDGRNPSVPKGYEDGYFVGPTVFSNVKRGMRIYDEEIFGPVICCVEMDTYDEAIKFVNENKYGN